MKMMRMEYYGTADRNDFLAAKAAEWQQTRQFLGDAQAFIKKKTRIAKPAILKVNPGPGWPDWGWVWIDEVVRAVNEARWEWNALDVFDVLARYTDSEDPRLTIAWWGGVGGPLRLAEVVPYEVRDKRDGQTVIGGAVEVTSGFDESMGRDYFMFPTYIQGAIRQHRVLVPAGWAMRVIRLVEDENDNLG
jgi:hypothetical protein